MGEPAQGDADEPPPPVWAAGAVARRLGVAPATLRTWHRRYGLGPQEHRPGSYRRYGEQDVAVLETMARLVAQGVVPAAAAQIARERSQAMGRVVADETAERITAHAVRGLVLAAQRLDAETLRHVLDEEFSRARVEATWEELCVPALTALGRRVGPAGECIDAVLLLSWAITASLHLGAGPARSRSRSRRVLLACADGERHSLGLEVLNAVLTQRRIPSNMLGASVPAPVLAAAASRIRPAAVVVWAQMPRTARPSILRAVGPLAETTIAAGPGWDRSRLPDGVLRVTALRAAADTIAQLTALGAAVPAPDTAPDTAPDAASDEASGAASDTAGGAERTDESDPADARPRS